MHMYVRSYRSIAIERMRSIDARSVQRRTKGAIKNMRWSERAHIMDMGEPNDRASKSGRLAGRRAGGRGEGGCMQKVMHASIDLIDPKIDRQREPRGDAPLTKRRRKEVRTEVRAEDSIAKDETTEDQEDRRRTWIRRAGRGLKHRGLEGANEAGQHWGVGRWLSAGAETEVQLMADQC